MLRSKRLRCRFSAAAHASAKASASSQALAPPRRGSLSGVAASDSSIPWSLMGWFWCPADPEPNVYAFGPLSTPLRSGMSSPGRGSARAEDPNLFGWLGDSRKGAIFGASFGAPRAAILMQRLARKLTPKDVMAGVKESIAGHHWILS